MKLIKHILLFTTIIFIVSCKKYLDKKTDTTLVVPKTIKDLQGLLDDFSNMNSITPTLGETSADDFFVLPNNYNSFYEYDRNLYTWQLKQYTYRNDWSRNYSAIFNANYCLKFIDDIPKTLQNENDWNNIKGSAYFFRAFSFLNLAWQHAKAYDVSTANTDLGIPLRLGIDFNIPSTRANVKDTYDQIISDGKEALSLLPDNPLLSISRPSKGASYALLARTYLSMREYDSAYKYADLSLGIKNNLLNYNSSEIVTGNVPFRPLNKEIIFYTTLFRNASIALATSVAKIDSTLFGSYNSNDLRKVIFFRPASGYQRFKGSYAASATELFSGLAVDEMLLIRAECNARDNKIDDAMNDLNALLINRFREGTFIPFYTSDKDEAIAIILQERRKELVMRGIRWSDIKRLNKEGKNIIPRRIIDGHIYELPPNDSRYALPIPQDVIDISGMPQN